MEEAAVEAPEQLLQVHHPVALLFLRHLLRSAPSALLHLAVHFAPTNSDGVTIAMYFPEKRIPKYFQFIFQLI
jgi:hypothetical protein